MTARPKSIQPLPADAKRVFEGTIFDVYQWEQKLLDGSTATFEKIVRDDTVIVLSSLPDKRLLLVEDEQPARGTILNFPGGRLDEGEEPLAAGKRELLEETGYASDDWEFYKADQAFTKIDWAVYVFVARNCRKIADIANDPGERTEVQILTLDELIAKAEDPHFFNRELKYELLKARYDPEERKKLEKILFG